jgi:hypothetical protein
MSLVRSLYPSLALAATLALAACGTAPGVNLPQWAGGLPADAPAASAKPPPYPNVYDLPPARATKPIPVSEQERLEAELTATRKKINARADRLQKQDSNE